MSLFFFFIVFFFCFFFILFFYFVNFFLSYKNMDFYLVSSFESGFQSVGKIQSNFSVHFFLIILLFVVFDVEIVIILGFVLSDEFSFFGFFIIFFFLLFSLYLEWFFNKLVWSL